MFDTKSFLIDCFKTPTGLIAFLRAYNADLPSDETARKWFQRGSVPADWFAYLLAWLEIDRGAPISLARYLDAGDR